MNVFYSENTPIYQFQSYIGIVLFAVVITLGIILGQYILRSIKEKPIEVPPTGINYIQLACPKCGRPVLVYPPAEKYKEVVSSECEDKDGEVDHNKKDKTRCRNCRKTFGFFWCTGHFLSESIPKRKFRF
jgi:hypothetical protein